MEQVEHVIIGAGIAGLVLAHLLESDRVVLLDPNPGSYKIGESLVPELYRHPELRKLLPKVRQLPSFNEKHGSLFVGPESAVNFPLAAAESTIAMHVYRPELERLLVAEWGLEIRREKVVDIDFDHRVVRTDRGAYDIEGQIIDCSGPAMVVANMLGEVESLLEVHARWRYHDIVSCDNARYLRRLEERGRSLRHYDLRHDRIVDSAETLGSWTPSHSTILTQVEDGVWCWQIPLYDSTVLSFGVVSRHGEVTPEAYARVVESHAADCFDLRPRPASDHPLDREHARSGFARRAKRAASEDFILIADAFAFSDPVYSVGVGFAASQASTIASRLNKGPWDADAVTHYCERTEELVARAFAAFELWYRGETTTSDEAAREVQHGCLHSRMFDQSIIEHYGNVTNDTDLEVDGSPGSRDPFHPVRGAKPLTEDVGRLLQVDEIAGWRRGTAVRCTGGVRVSWRDDRGEELNMLIGARDGDGPSYRSLGALQLSYLAPLGADAYGDLTPLFDGVSTRVREREGEWLRFVESAG